MASFLLNLIRKWHLLYIGLDQGTFASLAGSLVKKVSYMPRIDCLQPHYLLDLFNM